MGRLIARRDLCFQQRSGRSVSPISRVPGLPLDRDLIVPRSVGAFQLAPQAGLVISVAATPQSESESESDGVGRRDGFGRLGP